MNADGAFRELDGANTYRFPAEFFERRYARIRADRRRKEKTLDAVLAAWGLNGVVSSPKPVARLRKGEAVSNLVAEAILATFPELKAKYLSVPKEGDGRPPRKCLLEEMRNSPVVNYGIVPIPEFTSTRKGLGVLPTLTELLLKKTLGSRTFRSHIISNDEVQERLLTDLTFVLGASPTTHPDQGPIQHTPIFPLRWGLLTSVERPRLGNGRLTYAVGSVDHPLFRAVKLPYLQGIESSFADPYPELFDLVLKGSYCGAFAPAYRVAHWMYEIGMAPPPDGVSKTVHLMVGDELRAWLAENAPDLQFVPEMGPIVSLATARSHSSYRTERFLTVMNKLKHPALWDQLYNIHCLFVRPAVLPRPKYNLRIAFAVDEKYLEALTKFPRFLAQYCDDCVKRGSHIVWREKSGPNLNVFVLGKQISLMEQEALQSFFHREALEELPEGGRMLELPRTALHDFALSRWLRWHSYP